MKAYVGINRPRSRAVLAPMYAVHRRCRIRVRATAMISFTVRANVRRPLADVDREDVFSERSVRMWTQTSLRTLRPEAISAEAAGRQRKNQEAYRNAPHATEDPG